MQTSPHNKHLVGRYLQALVVGKGSPHAALAFAESQGHWLDRSQVIGGLKAAVGAMGTTDMSGSYTPIADAFLAAMRGTSVSLRLENMKRVPLLTRLYIASSGVVVGEVAEGASIPLVRGNWATATLTPRKFAGLAVLTEELVRSMDPVASLALTGDLADATAGAENRAFVSPDVPGSVLYSASNFNGTGSGLAQVDADLKRLIDSVPGASRPGAAFLMTSATSTALSLLRGSGGSLAFPGLGPTGGVLLNLPVLVTDACQQPGSPPTRIIGLVDPGSIFFADEGTVVLTTSTDAALQMDSAPTGDSLTPTAGEVVSMFQSNSVALRALRESAWYARPGAGAYFTAGF